jgi:ABC-2 type transport system ATP-binding protein
MAAMIEIRDLRKDFGEITAVNGISFSVERGEVLGFLGPNGAGKSTTMRMITGFLPPTSGTALVNGHDVTSDVIAAKRQIGYLPENAPVYGDMTVTHFLKFVAEIRGFTGKARDLQVDAAIDKARLAGVRHQSISTLSKGYRQRVCFAQAILHDPPILIMDEPTDGLDPNQKHVVRNMILEMAPRKVIIISTHILEEVEAVCSRAIIIAGGRIVANGTPAELKAHSNSHGAVELAVQHPTDQIAAELRALPSATRVESAGNLFTIYPRDPSRLFAEVTQLVKQRDWHPTGLKLIEGRLDDVFRDLTLSGDANRN